MIVFLWGRVAGNRAIVIDDLEKTGVRGGEGGGCETVGQRGYQQNVVVQINNRIKKNTMATNYNQGYFSGFSSLFSSSLSIEDLPRMDFSLNSLKSQEPAIPPTEGRSLELFDEDQLEDLQLKRCTSFEDMLLETHRNVLVSAMLQYLETVSHPILRKIKPRSSIGSSNFARSDYQMEMVEKVTEGMTKTCKAIILQQLPFNSDDLKIVSEILDICPDELRLPVLWLLVRVLQQSQNLIDNFRRKEMPQRILEKSQLMVKKLQGVQWMNGLLIESASQEALYILVEKWILTGFLMKVGVFQNELQTKSVEECFQSQLFRRIDQNDLLNQHLLKPSKKVKNH